MSDLTNLLALIIIAYVLGYLVASMLAIWRKR